MDYHRRIYPGFSLIYLNKHPLENPGIVSFQDPKYQIHLRILLGYDLVTRSQDCSTERLFFATPTTPTIPVETVGWIVGEEDGDVN